MQSLIDLILSETRNSNVVSEQHDTSKIDWEAGLADKAEMLKLGKDVVQAAIARADLDTTTGRVAVMVAGRPPWHRLGVNVAGAVSGREAIVHASLNWKVSKRSLSYQFNGQLKDQTDAFAIVRDDTGACLGTVGSRYAAIQNEEGFSFLDDCLGEFGAKFETAGAIHGGKKVWMLAQLPNSSFEVGSGDEVKSYAIFVNPHDGSGQAWCYPTSERVVCANTLRVALNDRSKGIGIRHTGSVKDKIAAAKRALGLSVAGFKTFADSAAQMAKVRVASSNAYFNTVLDAVLPVTAAEVSLGAVAVARSRVRQDVSTDEFELCVKTAEKEIRSRGEILEDIIERFHSERCLVNGISGTVWSALNAVTEHADYYGAKRNVRSFEAQQSRRFESILDGDRDEMKQVAYSHAVAMAKA